MAHKEHLKKAVQGPDGGITWTWSGQGEITHAVTWHKNGQTFWTVSHDGTVLRTEEPWFLVKVRGEVQENIKYYRNNGLDLVLGNRALLAVGMEPNQHTDAKWCTCLKCTCPF